MVVRLSPCGRGRIASKDAIRVRGFSPRVAIAHLLPTASGDGDPSSVADFVRATFSHKGRRDNRPAFSILLNSQTVRRVIHPFSHHHRAKRLAKAQAKSKAKRVLKWQRDPEGMRLRILEAAKQEFSAHGLAGARVDRIAAKAGANKRMLYYHVGNKEDLYLTVLEGAYEKIRGEERTLALEHLDPPEAIRTLIDFTWNHFLRNPEFLALLHTENLARAKHLKRSSKVKSMHSPFVEMIGAVVRRGVKSGDFHAAVDPVQLYISIAALSFFYLSNSATLGVIFGRDLLSREARDERLDHMTALVLAALTGKSSAVFGRNEEAPMRSPERSGAA